MAPLQTNGSDDLNKPLLVGGIELRNRVFLAPMSGITDLPFRNLAWRLGAGLVVSEMVASQALIEGLTEMEFKQMRGEVPLHVVQLAGRGAHWMRLAAKMVEANGANIIDINMGCPAKRVTTGYSGSALMRDLDHALTLIDAVVGAVDIPVTLKMRLGWDDASINAPELAQRAEAAGVQMITVHGRTRCQFYKGNADWTKVKAVRDATRLPLVVNGDIIDFTSANAASAVSGADAIMIGRGSYGAPWLPGKIAGFSQETLNKAQTIIEHYEHMLDFYGKGSGIRQARKHLAWYLNGVEQTGFVKTARKAILTSSEPKEIIKLLEAVFKDTAVSDGNLLPDAKEAA